VRNRERDNLVNYYKVDSKLIRRWNRSIIDLQSTVKEPGPSIIIDLVNRRTLRDKRKRKLLTATTTTTTTSALATSSDSPAISRLVEAIALQSIVSLQAHLPTPPSPSPITISSVAITTSATLGSSYSQALILLILPSSPVSSQLYDEVL
jgi:hypothetical protein